MTASATRKPTPLHYDAAYAQSIVATAERELASPRWSREARGHLHDIVYAALGVQGLCEGHAEFADAPAELEALLIEWAEGTDYRTFPAAERPVSFGEAA
jgi:hypothetical protein